MNLFLSELIDGVYPEEVIRNVISKYGTDDYKWFIQEVFYIDIYTEYKKYFAGLLHPAYWRLISRYIELSEEFLIEYDKYIIKREIFTQNYRTCKDLSLDYIFANSTYIEDGRVFKDLLPEEDYNFLKNIWEIKQ